jgi:E3 ubiquitin-protein ligase DOA10
MLKRHDLKGTISPIISVDEFEAKAGSDAEVVVIAFYLDDENPAKDLDSFIERSAFEVVDVDVSPNPDEDGNYLVFVEIKREPESSELLKELIKDIENVTDTMDWTVKTLGGVEMPLAEFDLTTYLAPTEVSDDEETDDEETEEDEVQESLLRNTLASVVINESKTITMQAPGITLVLEKIDFGDAMQIINKHELLGKALDLFYSSPKLTALKNLLGENWSIEVVDKKLLVTEHTTNKAFIFGLL